MAFRCLDQVSSIGASRPVRLPTDVGTKNHAVTVDFEPTGVAAVSALTISLQGSSSNKDADTGVVTPAGLVAASSGGNSGVYLAIGTTFTYLIVNTNYTAALATAGQAFTSAHVIGNGADDLYGAINVYIDSSGVLKTSVPLTPQLYASSALAFAAANGWVRGTNYPTLWCPVGRLIIRCTAKTWTANTDDLTAGSDLTSIQFVSFSSSFRDLVSHAFTADELTAQRTIFSIEEHYVSFVRLFLSVLTGSALVTARYLPEDRP